MIFLTVCLAFALSMANKCHSSSSLYDANDMDVCTTPFVPSETSEWDHVKTKSQVTSLAVVPYEEEKLLPHEKRMRQFLLAGHEFKISQDWQMLGVAAVVWDSAIVLSEYLSSHPHLVAGQKVLELGAGTGLAGMVAAALGGDVTMTERSEAMGHLQATVTSNTKDTWKVKASILDWTQPLDETLMGQFDLILGADIVYIEATFPDLLRTLVELTEQGRSGMQILLSCRIRYDRDLSFLNMLEQFFIVRDLYFDKERDVKLFRAERKS